MFCGYTFNLPNYSDSACKDHQTLLFFGLPNLWRRYTNTWNDVLGAHNCENVRRVGKGAEFTRESMWGV
jgi:hypothetical protein